MSKIPINEVLADNLRHFMAEKEFTQSALGEKCGIAQTTVSLYLNPDRRKLGATGKKPSAKLSEVELLANGLGVEVWQLLRHMTKEERKAYEKLEEAFRTFRNLGMPMTDMFPETNTQPSNPQRVKIKRIQPAQETGKQRAA